MKKVICLASLTVMTASVCGMPFDNLRENQRNRDAVLPQQEVRNEEQTLNNNQFENNKRLIVATRLPGKLGIDKMKELLDDGADPNFEFNGDTPYLKDWIKSPLVVRFANIDGNKMVMESRILFG